MDLFSFSQLMDAAKEKSSQYQDARPVPHIAIDNILNQKIIESAANSFPEPNNSVWYRYDNPLEKKLATNRLQQLPTIYREIFQELNSQEFLLFLEELSGIKGLITDPHLNGGGLHRIDPGYKLDVHIDYNYHPVTNLDRRLNALIYLNKNWKEEYQGHFQLWANQNGKILFPQQRYLPIFNRLVIFSVSDQAYHGHPEPLQCPEGMSRKALAVYYYTNGRPENEKTPKHSTVFVPRPGEPEDPELQTLRAKRARGRLNS